MQIAPQISARGHSLVGVIQSIFYKLFTLLVPCVRQTVFGYVNGLVIFFKAHKYPLQAFGMYAKTHIGQIMATAALLFKTKNSNMMVEIIVDANKITGADCPA